MKRAKSSRLVPPLDGFQRPRFFIDNDIASIFKSIIDSLHPRKKGIISGEYSPPLFPIIEKNQIPQKNPPEKRREKKEKLIVIENSPYGNRILCFLRK